MKTFSGFAYTLSQNDLHDLYAYRYDIFIGRLGWDLPNATEHQEIDQFDRADTIHIGLRNSAGNLCGCARLLPTNRPYLLGDVFPQLMGDGPVPKSSEIWEISRFAAVDLDNPMSTTPQSRQFEMWLSKEILAHCIRLAIANGAKRLITVSPVGIERLLLRMGVNFCRASQPMRIGEHKLFACWIEIDIKTTNVFGIRNAHLPNKNVINTTFEEQMTL